jgi:hypothetical protein
LKIEKGVMNNLKGKTLMMMMMMMKEEKKKEVKKKEKKVKVKKQKRRKHYLNDIHTPTIIYVKQKKYFAELKYFSNQ